MATALLGVSGTMDPFGVLLLLQRMQKAAVRWLVDEPRRYMAYHFDTAVAAKVLESESPEAALALLDARLDVVAEIMAMVSATAAASEAWDWSNVSEEVLESLGVQTRDKALELLAGYLGEQDQKLVGLALNYTILQNRMEWRLVRALESEGALDHFFSLESGQALAEPSLRRFGALLCLLHIPAHRDKAKEEVRSALARRLYDSAIAAWIALEHAQHKSAVLYGIHHQDVDDPAWSLVDETEFDADSDPHPDT